MLFRSVKSEMEEVEVLRDDRSGGTGEVEREGVLRGMWLARTAEGERRADFDAAEVCEDRLMSSDQREAKRFTHSGARRSAPWELRSD